MLEQGDTILEPSILVRWIITKNHSLYFTLSTVTKYTSQLSRMTGVLLSVPRSTQGKMTWTKNVINLILTSAIKNKIPNDTLNIKVMRCPTKSQ